MVAYYSVMLRGAEQNWCLPNTGALTVLTYMYNVQIRELRPSNQLCCFHTLTPMVLVADNAME